jgi:hypothetical protein
MIKYLQDNPNVELQYPCMDVSTLSLHVFSNAACANNDNFACQLGYLAFLSDGTGNCALLDFKSMKAKRVTRSILAGELIAFAEAFDRSFVLKNDLEDCCVKHAHVSQTLLASLYGYRLDSLLVLYISTYVLHLYEQRSNMTYSCSRLIKLAQATRAQKPHHQIWPRKPCASMPQKMLPNQLPISRPVFIGYFKYQISGTCAINYLAQLTF